MLVEPAPFIRYPHSKNRRNSFYRVDQEVIDPILVRQKDMVYEMYNHMTNTNLSLHERHTLRQQAFELLELLYPLWVTFDYCYKYHELKNLFLEHTIV